MADEKQLTGLDVVETTRKALLDGIETGDQGAWRAFDQGFRVLNTYLYDQKNRALAGQVRPILNDFITTKILSDYDKGQLGDDTFHGHLLAERRSSSEYKAMLEAGIKPDEADRRTLHGIYGSSRLGEKSSYVREASGLDWWANLLGGIDEDRRQIPTALADLRIDSDPVARAERERAAESFQNPVVEENGKRFVEVGGAPQKLIDFTDEEKALIHFARNGLGEHYMPVHFARIMQRRKKALMEERNAWVRSKIDPKDVEAYDAEMAEFDRQDEEEFVAAVARGEDPRYYEFADITTFGEHFVYVPKVTGNYELDRKALEEDPVYVRSLIEAKPPRVDSFGDLFDDEKRIPIIPGVVSIPAPDVENLFSHALSAADTGIMLADFMATTRVLGGVARAIKPGASLAKGLGSLGKNPMGNFYATYAGEAATAATGADLGAAAVPGFLRGAPAGVAEMVGYEMVRGAVVGDSTFPQSISAGISTGVTALAFGAASRAMRRRVGVSVNPATRALRNLSGDFERDVKKVTNSKIAAAQAGAVIDSVMVWNGFRAKAYMDEVAQERGTTGGFQNPANWGPFLAALADPSKGPWELPLVGGAAAALSVMGSKKAKGTRGYEMSEAVKDVIIERVRQNEARQRALEDTIESTTLQVARKALEAPELTVKAYEELLHQAKTEDVQHLIREFTGRLEPTAGDPRNTAAFSVGDWMREFDQAPEWVASEVQHTAKFALRKTLDDIRSLPTYAYEPTGTPAPVMPTAERYTRIYKDPERGDVRVTGTEAEHREAAADFGPGRTPWYPPGQPPTDVVKQRIPSRPEVRDLRSLVSGELQRRAEMEASKLESGEAKNPDHARELVETEIRSAWADRMRDPYAQELERMAAGGAMMPDVSIDLLSNLGYKSRKHALYSVNKRLGRSYTSEAEVPAQDILEAGRGRLAERLTGQAAESLRSLHKALKLDSLAVTPDQIETARDRVWDALRRHPDRQEMDRTEMFADWVRQEHLVSAEALEARVKEAEALAVDPKAEHAVLFGLRNIAADADVAFESLARVKVRGKDGKTEPLVDVDQAPDAPANANWMHALYLGSESVRRAFEQSVELDGTPTYPGQSAGMVFEAARARLRKAQDAAKELFAREAAEEGWQQSITDAREFDRLRREGEPFPDDLLQRLHRQGWLWRVHGEPLLAEGVERFIAANHFATMMDRIQGKGPVEPGQSQFLAVTDPITALFGFKPGATLDAVEKRLVNKLVSLVDPTPHRWLDYVMREFEAGRTDTRSYAAVNRLTRAIYRDSVQRFLTIFGIPERSPLFSYQMRGGARDFRTSWAREHAWMMDMFRASDVLITNIGEAALTPEQNTLFTRAVDSHGKRRFKSAEEFGRWVGAANPAEAGKLFNLFNRYIDWSNGLLDRGKLNGVWNEKQAAKYRSHYLPLIRAKTPEEALKAVAERSTDVRSWGVISQELERASSGQDMMHVEMDPRVYIRAQAAGEVRRIALFGLMRRFVHGEAGAIHGAEYEALPHVIKREYTKLSVEEADYLPRKGEINRDWLRRTNGYTLGANMLGTRVKEIREGMESEREAAGREKGKTPSRKKAPRTAMRQQIVESLSDMYVPTTVAKEIELMLATQDPSYFPTGPTKILADGITLWKLDKTVTSPQHLVQNFWTSILSNHALGGVPMLDAVTSLVTGKGHYANGMRGVALWHDWANGVGEFKDLGSKNMDALRGHEFRDLILKADTLMGMLHGSTLSTTYLSDIDFGTYVGAALDPISLGSTDPLGRTLESPALLAQKVRKPMRDFSERITAAFAASDPVIQAQGIRNLQAMYALNEAAIKLANFDYLAKTHPTGDLGEMMRWAMRGSGDYGSASPWMLQYTSMIAPGRRSELKEHARKVRHEGRRLVREGIGRSTLVEDVSYSLAGSRAAQTVTSIFIQKPFLTYPMVMIPELIRGAGDNPLRVITAIAVGTALYKMVGAAQDEANDTSRDMLMEGLYGDPSYSDIDDPVPSEEAIRYFAQRHDVGAFLGMNGETKFLGDVYERAEKEWKKEFVERGLLARTKALERIGQRGTKTRFMDIVDTESQLGLLPTMMHSAERLFDDYQPSGYFGHNTWADYFQGFLAAEAIQFGSSAVRALSPRAGRTRQEEFGGLVRSGRRIFGAELNPATFLMSGAVAETLSIMAEDGVDPWTGILDPALARQPAGEKMRDVALSALFPVRTLNPRSKVLGGREGFFTRGALEFIGATGRSTASKDPITRDRDVIARRLSEQTRLLAEAAYHEAAYGGLQGLGVEPAIGAYFNVTGDLTADFQHLKDVPPTTPLGQFIKNQVEQGLPEDLAIQEVMSYLHTSRFDKQKALLLELAGRARMDTGLFGMLWQKSDLDGTGTAILKQAEIELLGKKDYSNLSHWKLYVERLIRDAASSGRVLSKDELTLVNRLAFDEGAPLELTWDVSNPKPDTRRLLGPAFPELEPMDAALSRPRREGPKMDTLLEALER